MEPSNPLADVRRLVHEQKYEFFKVVSDELARRNMDSDDLLDVICSDLGERHCYKTDDTVRHHTGTKSDYYSLWVTECSCMMFLKLLISRANGAELLVVTSFKKDTNYV